MLVCSNVKDDRVEEMGFLGFDRDKRKVMLLKEDDRRHTKGVQAVAKEGKLTLLSSSRWGRAL